MSRISVLIPCYNAGSYLGEALHSVMSQGVTAHEIIVLDDGSTDDSASIARSFGDRVTYRRQENLGISAARNAALALASGDLIAFLDADDLWPSGSLARRLHVLAEDETVEYVYGAVEQFVSPDTPADLARVHEAQLGATQAARLGGAMLVRRCLFDRIGNFDTAIRVGETIDWVSRADAAGASNRGIPQVVLRRRLHATNTGIRLRDSRTDYLAVARAALARRRESATR